MAPSRTPAMWADRMGLELFTVRDQMDKDFEGTLAQVAAAGYKDVETTSYRDADAAQVRAALDKAGLTAPSTHVALAAGPELERQLAGYQQIGHRTRRRVGPGGPGGPPPGGRAGGPPGGAAPGGAPPGGGRGGAPSSRHRLSIPSSVRPRLYNQIGAAGKPYGIKVLIHNHTNEFQPFADRALTPYEVLFANIDPESRRDGVGHRVVHCRGTSRVRAVRQVSGPIPALAREGHGGPQDRARHGDAGGAAARGEDRSGGVGRYRLSADLRAVADAGLVHYYIEQDTAPATGSLDAMRLSAPNLRRSLS